MITQKQLTLADIFEDCQEIFESDKPQFLTLLENHIDLDEIIEELIFRGFLFKAMAKDGIKSAIIVSSITFGLGHIINLVNGAELLPTFLQIIYATALGFLFTMLFHKGKCLWPCIITHSVVNSLSVIGVEGTTTEKIISAVILTAVSLGYIALIYKNKKE